MRRSNGLAAGCGPGPAGIDVTSTMTCDMNSKVAPLREYCTRIDGRPHAGTRCRCGGGWWPASARGERVRDHHPPATTRGTRSLPSLILFRPHQKERRVESSDRLGAAVSRKLRWCFTVGCGSRRSVSSSLVLHDRRRRGTEAGTVGGEPVVAVAGRRFRGLRRACARRREPSRDNGPRATAPHSGSVRPSRHGRGGGSCNGGASRATDSAPGRDRR